MADIGFISLKNTGAFVARIQFEYWNNSTSKWVRTDNTGDITAGFSKTSSPGECNVPDGSTVRLHVSVALGSDKDSSESYTYKKGNANIAKYTISGTTLSNTLKYDGLDIHTIYVSGVTVSPTSSSLKTGESKTLSATVAPSNATNNNVTWSSSNRDVATVSTSGLVTAKGAGNATITVTTADGGKTATCAVTVAAITVAPTGVALSKTQLSLIEGSDETLIATVAPPDATNPAVTWTSSDNAVATVASGKVTAKGVGKATITVTTADGGKTATCAVTVAANTVAPTGVTVSPTSSSLKVGETKTLTATVAPPDATNPAVTWTSSDMDVATVASGKVTAKGVGKATITVTTAVGGKKATCAVTVAAADTAPQITTQPKDTTANVGSKVTFTVSATGNPTPSYQWQVSAKNSTSWVDIKNDAVYSGATTNTLTIANSSTTLDGCKYKCVVKNSAGSATSSAAALKLQEAPKFLSQPKDLTVEEGKEAYFSVTATGFPAPAYQWQISADGFKWDNIEKTLSAYGGMTGNKLTISKTPYGYSGFRYRCVAAVAGLDAIESEMATLTVTEAPKSNIADQQIQINLYKKLKDADGSKDPLAAMKIKIQNKKLKPSEKITKEELRVAKDFFTDWKEKYDSKIQSEESTFWNKWHISSPLYDFVRWFNLGTIESLMLLFDQSQSVSSSLIPIKGISKIMQAKLKAEGIYDIAGLLTKAKTQAKREKLAYNLDVDVRLVNTWVKQANLWQVESITTDMAYLLVQIGIRNPDDLSKVDEELAYPILERLVLTQPDFILLEKSKLVGLIEAAQGYNTHSCANKGTFETELAKAINDPNRKNSLTKEEIVKLFEKSVKNVSSTSIYIEYNEEEPFYLFKKDFQPIALKTNAEIIREGLAFLENVPLALPLPCVISGRIFGEKTISEFYETGYPNLLVEISGISSSSTDKNDTEKIPSAYTDGSGYFRIILPEKLNLQEGIIFTASDGSWKQKFLRSASDIIQAVPQQEILNLFYELKSIADLIAYKDTVNIRRAMLVHDKTVVETQITPLEAIPADKITREELEKLAGLKEELSRITRELKELDSNTASKTENADLEKDYKTKKESIVKLYNELKSAVKPYSNDLEIILQNLVSSDNQYEARFYQEETRADENGVKEVVVLKREFIIIDAIFKGYSTGLARALPSVKLMGEGDKAIHLPTDTAPSRVFNYGMLQRLVEPVLGPKGTARRMLERPVDVMDFKARLYTNPDSYPQMASLGIGYFLNMHQAWVPDGFALGSLLYSIVLAPGEEQRLVVRENKQSYSVSDDLFGVDTDKQEYELSQTDDTTAAYNYALNQLLNGNSDYNYNAHADSFGGGYGGAANVAQGMFNLGSAHGLSGATSNARGSGSASASQSNAHNEVSNAAQLFQHSIKSAADRISQSKRISMRTAASEESNSVATKIIANHNHSHTMTIQYWEVMRRFRLETCIDGIDLALFVPLRLIKFIPDGNYAPNLTNFSRERFDRRYDVLLKYADNLMYALPYKYRTGLSLIKKYAAYPDWKMENVNVGSRQLTITFNCDLMSFDDLTVSLSLKNKVGTIAGTAGYDRRKLSDFHETRRELLKDIRDIRNGSGKKERKYHLFDPLKLASDRFFPFTEEDHDPKVTCTFTIPNTITDDDLSHITLHYSCEGLEYSLYQNPKYVEQKGPIADFINRINPVNHLTNAVNTNPIEFLNPFKPFQMLFGGGKKDEKQPELPEAYRDPIVNLTSQQVLNLGAPLISNLSIESEGFDGLGLLLSSSSLNASSPVMISLTNRTPILRYAELQEMEETMHHIAADTLHYSQSVWASLSDDERAMMLEQYTIDMDFGKIIGNEGGEPTADDEPSNGTGLVALEANSKDVINIPLLNCVNIKKMLGFYGNCILLPFTYPQELAKKLKKTAAEVQDALYRYHTHCFRVPTTTISLPTDGMIGEAVLGETNVSELIDLTRFWNWKDSPIDKMEIDSSYLNNTDYLADKTTKDITALNLPGATPAQPVTVPDLISALVGKQTPTFADITGLDQLKDILNAGTNSAASGRKEVLDTTAKLAELSTEILKDSKIAGKNGNSAGGGGSTTGATTKDGVTTGGTTTGGTTKGGVTTGGTTYGGTTTGGVTEGGVTTGGTLTGDTITGGVTTGGTTTGGVTTGGTTTGGTTTGGVTTGGTTTGGTTTGGTTTGGTTTNSTATGGTGDGKQETFGWNVPFYYDDDPWVERFWAKNIGLLFSWKNNVQMHLGALLRRADEKDEKYINCLKKGTIDFDDYYKLVAVLGLTREPYENYPSSFYLNLLKTYGPLILIIVKRDEEKDKNITVMRLLCGMGTKSDNPIMAYKDISTKSDEVKLIDFESFSKEQSNAVLSFSGIGVDIIHFKDPTHQEGKITYI